jgi:hypothetical protein
MSDTTLTFAISNSQSQVQLVDDPSEPGWEDFLTRRQSEDGPKDETEYLLGDPRNAARLRAALDSDPEERVRFKDLDELRDRLGI